MSVRILEFVGGPLDGTTRPIADHFTVLCAPTNRDALYERRVLPIAGEAMYAVDVNWRGLARGASDRP